MRKIFIPLLSAVTLLLLQSAQAQGNGNPDTYQISVQSALGRYIGINYAFSPSVTKVYPTQIQKSTDGWRYEIILTIKPAGENLVWNTPIGVTLIFPDGNRQNKIINNESKPLYSNNLYEFRFTVVCRRKGWAMIQMYPLDEWDKQNVRNVDFRTSEVCLE